MKSSELLRILQRDGWYVVSQKGSHIKMVHSVKKETIIFPYHGRKEMKKGLEKRILKDSGLL